MWCTYDSERLGCPLRNLILLDGIKINFLCSIRFDYTIPQFFIGVLIYFTIPIWELKVFLSAWRHFCDDNSDGDDDDDDVFISSHSSTLDPPAASYISNPTPHNANIIYIRQMRLPNPLLAPKRLEFGVIGERWGWGRRHVDDNHALFCVLWCFINQYSAESCTGNIIQCI